MIQAPFTPEQVKFLNEFQACDNVHPFTCGTLGCKMDDGYNSVLVATEDGWKCDKCDYTQDWAHDFMANGSMAKNATQMMERMRKQDGLNE